jgi:dephospho-CoA kinase
MTGGIAGNTTPGRSEAAARGPFVVGLVGRIASGKSTVAREFAALGARVIDADRIAHDVLDEPEARSAITARFGVRVLAPDGRVDRRALAAAVFGPTADGRGIGDLEAIVHPRVHGRIHEQLAQARAAGNGPGPQVVVLDVPLLVQAGWADACDRLVVVECADPVRRERLARRGWDAAEQVAREANWSRRFDPGILQPGKTARVDASGDVAYTRIQVETLWQEWLQTLRDVPQG